MIFLKTQEEIELLRESNRLVGKTLGEVSKHVRPGISTLELDKIAEDFIRSNGGIPGFLGYGGFPNTLCISVNDEVVHGIPSSRCLEEGDVVSVDCGVVKNGFYGDSAYTFAVGEISDEVKRDRTGSSGNADRRYRLCRTIIRRSERFFRREGIGRTRGREEFA